MKGDWGEILMGRGERRETHKAENEDILEILLSFSIKIVSLQLCVSPNSSTTKSHGET